MKILRKRLTKDMAAELCRKMKLSTAIKLRLGEILELESDPKAGDVLGSLKRYEGSFTGSDVLYVELTEPITASWLQWALIEAGEPANIHKL